MTVPYYYVYPFGQNADDLTAINTQASVDGSVSYYAGWTDPYEYDLTSNPSALPVPRGQMNQLFFDITNNLQEYQQYGTPQWVTSSQNLGSSVPYPIYARVYYGGVVYENQVASNTATPGADDTWLVVSGNLSGVPIGTIIDFAAGLPPTNYLVCDGTPQSRATYPELLTAISYTQSGTLTSTMNTVSGLTNATKLFYVGMPIECTSFIAGTTVASIVDNNNITLSNNSSTSGAASITFFPWGNGDGSTTFNLPQMQRMVTMGQGGSPVSAVNQIVGNSGGAETHTIAADELPAHTHPISLTAAGSSGTIPWGAGGGSPTSQSTGNNTTSNTAMNIVQPSTIVNKCIRYQ